MPTILLFIHSNNYIRHNTFFPPLVSVSSLVIFNRHLINSVKMGRGYFHMIRREALERKNMSLLDQQKEEQRRKSEFRPPKYPASSSSEEDTSDEEITE